MCLVFQGYAIALNLEQCMVANYVHVSEHASTVTLQSF